MNKKNWISMLKNILFIIFIVFSFSFCSTTNQVQKNTESPSDETITNEETTSEEELIISDELYTKTFEDVESIILKVTAIINKKNYLDWLSYLTSEYINHYNSKIILDEISSTPFLKKNNIKLLSLEDYFNYVVVPSRSNARLDEINFIDSKRIKAYMIIGEKKIILYYMENIDNQWKITIWD
jgi:hypothetical protein